MSWRHVYCHTSRRTYENSSEFNARSLINLEFCFRKTLSPDSCHPLDLSVFPLTSEVYDFARQLQVSGRDHEG